MIALFIKEINNFFSSLIGYIAITVFLLINGLFLWIIPGQYNVFDAGYSGLETFFFIAPWVFLFLIPAITMRMFAEEKKTGTIELLLIRPITDIQIILAKYLSALSIVVFSIIPSLIYFYTIFQLGNEKGNIDVGGTWGAYIGLFFLGAIYVSIGIFASSLTKNQIVAFIISALLCFLVYIGFDAISYIPIFKNVQNLIMYFGIDEHYKLISKGVIDSRDLIYFLTTIIFFIILTKISLNNRSSINT